MRFDELSAPGALALQEASGAAWTYAQLRDAVARRAAELRSPDKALVFCLCRNNAATVIDYLAAREAGHAVALFDARLNADLRAQLLALYDPAWILDSGATEARQPAPAPAIDPDLALLLSTSGTTGSPKLVRLTAANVTANAFAIAAALGLDDGERPISSLPLHYSYGLSVLNSHLAAGACFVLTEEGLMQNGFWETFRKFECTSFAGVPYLYQILDRLDIDKLNIPSLRTLTQAGGKLIPSLIEKFHGRISARGGRMFVMYGQTEATARIAVLPWQDLPAKLGSAGLALPGGKLTIEDGEVVYQGPNVMQGYALNRADLALGDQMHGRLKTGDRGRLDPDGYLYLEGRNSREVKVFGLRVNLDEVEALLRVHGPTAVLAREEGMVAFCDWGDEEFRAAQRGALAAKLNLAHRAVELRYLHPIPTAASGKIAYDQLKELL